MTSNPNEFLFVEKYRPQTIDDCILPSNLKKTFNEIVKSGQLQNMLLTGTSGLGKTTIARALCNMLKLDYILINGSEESGIDVLRNKIRHFASTISLSGVDSCKVVILDEADYLNPQSTQPALRGFIEEFSSNCRFIFTCNFKNRIIEQLHSRLTVIEFNTTKKDLVALAGQFHDRLKKILDIEKIKYTDKALADLIIKHAPDWRRILNECQRHAASGEITAAAIATLSDSNILALIKNLKEKDFRSMRIWVANNNDIDAAQIYRSIYDCITDVAQPQSIPVAIITLADYQFKGAFVADREMNIVACLTELMASVEFR
jgi:DNA polymerase III delta prime subunit